MLQDKVLAEGRKEQLEAYISAAGRVVVTCHTGPDGDAIGSVTALVALLTKLGKQACGVVPNAFPQNLYTAPGADRLIIFEEDSPRARAILDEADLLVSLDYNALHRTGDAMPALLRASSAPRIMIDHHLDPETGDFAFTVSRPEMCSTCEVLLHVVSEMGWLPLLDADIASSIYLGMMTDTGAFSYASNRGEVFRCVALLLDQGIDKDRIYRNIFWGASDSRMRAMGYLLYVNMKLMKKLHTSIITMTNQEWRRFYLKTGDTEGFVNLPLQIEGIRLSIFLREDPDIPGKIRVSTRSVDDVPCNLLAQEYFSGGGHKNAAGGSLMCTMPEAVEHVKRSLQKFQNYLKEE